METESNTLHFNEQRAPLPPEYPPPAASADRLGKLRRLCHYREPALAARQT